MNEQHPLVGKRIANIKLAADRQAILFQFDDGGEMVVDTDADCCSYTWVEAIELPALGLPATVTAVENLDLPANTQKPESEFHKDADSLAYYGCKITTDRGEIVIDYRNDSNGYYGGSLCWPGESLYGGVHGQNISKREWRELS